MSAELTALVGPLANAAEPTQMWTEAATATAIGRGTIVAGHQLHRRQKACSIPHEIGAYRLAGGIKGLRRLRLRQQRLRKEGRGCAWGGDRVRTHVRMMSKRVAKFQTAAAHRVAGPKSGRSSTRRSGRMKGHSVGRDCRQTKTTVPVVVRMLSSRRAGD